MAMRREVNVKWSFEDRVTGSLKKLRKHFKDTAAEAKTAKALMRPLGKEIKAMAKEVDALGKTTITINRFYKSLARSTAAKVSLESLSKTLKGSKAAVTIFRVSIKNAEDAISNLNNTLDKGGMKKKDRLGLEKQRSIILDYVESLKVLRNEADKALTKAEQPKIMAVEPPKDLKKAIEVARKKVIAATKPPGDEAKRIDFNGIKPLNKQLSEQESIWEEIRDVISETVNNTTSLRGAAGRLGGIYTKLAKQAGFLGPPGLMGTGPGTGGPGIRQTRRSLIQAAMAAGPPRSAMGRPPAVTIGFGPGQKLPIGRRRVKTPIRPTGPQVGAYGRQTMGPPRPGGPRRPLGAGLAAAADDFKENIRAKIIGTAFGAAKAIDKLTFRFTGLGGAIRKAGGAVKTGLGVFPLFHGVIKKGTDTLTKYTRKIGLVAFMLSFTARRILRDYKQIINMGVNLVKSVTDVEGAFEGLTDIMSKLALGGELTGGRANEVTDLMLQWFDLGSKVQAQFAIMSLSLMRMGPAILRGILPGMTRLATVFDWMSDEKMVKQIERVAFVFGEAFADGLSLLAFSFPIILDALERIAPAIASFTVGIGEGALSVITIVDSIIRVAPWMETLIYLLGKSLVPAIALLVPLSGMGQAISALGMFITAALSPMGLFLIALGGIAAWLLDMDTGIITDAIASIPWDDMRTSAETAWSSLVEIVKTKAGEIKTNIMERLGLIDWTQIETDAMITFDALPGQIQIAMLTAETKISEILTSVGEAIAEVNWGQLVDDAALEFANILLKVGEWMEPIIAAIDADLSNVDWETIIGAWATNFVVWWGEKSSPIIDSIKNTIIDAFDQAWTAIKQKMPKWFKKIMGIDQSGIGTPTITIPIPGGTPNTGSTGIDEFLTNTQDLATTLNDLTQALINADFTAPTRDEREQARILGGFATGGTVPSTGAYMLHKGERVTPTYYNRTKGGGSTEINLNVFGLTMDDAIDKIKFELGRAVRKDLLME